MPDMNTATDDPWWIDDIQRRAFQFLFREVPEPEATRRRDIRSAMLGLFAAISANDAIDLKDAINAVWAQYADLWLAQVEARRPAPPPEPDQEDKVFAHPSDFDVVTTNTPEIS